MDDNTTIKELKEKVKKFCDVRDWDQFHSAKDLAIAVSIEVSELLELFRWKSEKEVEEVLRNKKEKVSKEIADILYFILRFAEKNNIDLSEALNEKMEENEKRYPIDKFKGSNKKYNEM